MSRDELALHNIANAARVIIDFAGGFNNSTFQPDWKTRAAVLYQLTIISEAVQRLSKEFRYQHYQIPWSLMTRLRNNLIHGHNLVDWDKIWKTAKSEMPELLSMLGPFLK